MKKLLKCRKVLIFVTSARKKQGEHFIVHFPAVVDTQKFSISDLLLAPRGSCLVSCDDQLRLWKRSEVGSWQQVKTFPRVGDTSILTEVVHFFSDDSVLLWHQLPQKQQSFSHWSSKGVLLGSFSLNPGLYERKYIRTFYHYTPNEQWVFTLDNNLVSAHCQMILWDATFVGRQCVIDLDEEIALPAEVDTFCFTPDNRFFFFRYGDWLYHYAFDTEAPNAHLLKKVSVDVPNLFQMILSPTGAVLAVTGPEFQIDLYRTVSVDHYATIQLDTYLVSAAFSPGGLFLACYDAKGAISLWDAQTGQRDLLFAAFPYPRKWPYQRISFASLAWSSDGKILLASGPLSRQHRHVILEWSIEQYRAASPSRAIAEEQKPKMRTSSEEEQIRKHASVLSNKASNLFYQQKYEQALDTYNQAILLNPHDWNAVNMKGTILYRQRRYEEALTIYQQVLMMKANEVVYQNIGNTMVHLHRYDEALTAFDHAIEADPLDDGPYIGKLNVLRLQDREQEAQTVLEEALQHDFPAEVKRDLLHAAGREAEAKQMEQEVKRANEALRSEAEYLWNKNIE